VGVTSEDVFNRVIESTTREVEDVSAELRGHSGCKVLDWIPGGGFVGLEDTLVEGWWVLELDDHGSGVIGMEFEANTIELVEGDDGAHERTNIKDFPDDAAVLVGELGNQIARALRFSLP